MTSKEPCLNSKKIVLSLATISFLASCANATLTPEIKTYEETNRHAKARSGIRPRSADNQTIINSLHNTQVAITGSGSHSVTIGSSGTLQANNNRPIIYVHTNGSNTLTLTNLTNNGTINGKVAIQNNKGGFIGTIAVNAFENTGQVNGQIYMGIWGSGSGTLNIDNFNNSGTITGSNGQGTVFFEGNANIQTFNNSGTITASNNNKGVYFRGNGTIQTFNNSGAITAKSEGINLSGISNIDSFTNSGLISADNKAIFASTSGSNNLTIKNLSNSGTINGKVSVENSNGNFTGTIAVNTFENTKQINGQIYMGVWGSNSGTLSIDNFNNSGTITTSNGQGVFFEGRNTNIKTFNNNNGLISGSEGVKMISGTIENFTNSGTINGNSAAVFIQNSIIKTLENKGTINSTGNIHWGGAIKLESGGTIENIINTGTINSATSAIVVSYGKFGTLTIKDGGVVYGKNAGITVGQWQTLGDLYIDGTSSNGKVSGIYSDNHGIALGVGSSTSKIELKNGGIIQGNVNGIRLEQAASLSGEIILSGKGSRVEGGSGAGISNGSGKIEGSIKVEDGATVTSSSGQAIS
ncbi:hypothetical protein P4R25_001499, partial [Campylobacter jejuni]|nr:hypothetical protein [Campylobacter jejuni]